MLEIFQINEDWKHINEDINYSLTYLLPIPPPSFPKFYESIPCNSNKSIQDLSWSGMDKTAVFLVDKVILKSQKHKG